MMDLKALLPLNFFVAVMLLWMDVSDTVSSHPVTERSIQNDLSHHRSITIMNHADTTVDIFWIDPVTGASVAIASSFFIGDKLILDTFVNHTIAIQPSSSSSSKAVESLSEEISSPAKSSVTAHHQQQQQQRVPTTNLLVDTDDESNRIEHMVSYLTVSSDEPEQLFVIQKGLLLEERALVEEAVSDDDHIDMSSMTTKASFKKNPTVVESMIGSCRQQYLENVTNLIQCVEEKTAATLIELNEELAFQREVRQNIANLNENYTCLDVTRETTKAKRTTTWSHQEDGSLNHKNEPIIRNVGILHEHHASQIHVIENFISIEECQAIQDVAEPLLHRGTVADGKGGSTMSPNRKAWQAGIATDDYSNTKNAIANVKRRIFAYTNHAVPQYNLTLDGQEDLMSIQYFGINSTAPRAIKGSDHNDAIITTTPDRYTPHCDGDCNNLYHKTGSRIATMVLYCTIPGENSVNVTGGGGGTNFQQANVYVKPTIGSGVFFSYMDPITLIHDEGYTTHSGCPVLYGTKRIVVQWMRYGVDKMNPWDSFDTNNIKIA